MGAALTGAFGPSRVIGMYMVDYAPAVSHLFADVDEALPVYADLMGMDQPLVLETDSLKLLRSCDTMLLGVMYDADKSDRRLEVPMRALEAGTRIYALGATASADPAASRPVVDALADLCPEYGLHWMGCTVIGDGDLYSSMASEPRMGVTRRWASEPVDRLIHAMLAERITAEDLVRPSRCAQVLEHLR